MDSACLKPPKKLLAIISNWIEKTPQFLYAARLIDKKTDLPLFRGASKTPRSPASPLAGLMQWCILSPCDHTKHALGEASLRTAKDSKPREAIDSVASATTPTCTSEEETVKQSAGNDGTENVKTKDEAMDFQTLMAKLHANLLSVILSDSQSFPHETLTSDHVAVIVAALLGLSNHQPTQLKKRGKGEEKKKEDGDRNQDLDESVERLAQLLQISLSTGLLALSSGKHVSVHSLHAITYVC